jgi:hypothetical protein
MSGIQNTSVYDMFTTFFTVFGALTSGIVLGFTVVSYMVYDKDYKYEEDEDEGEEEYCFKFFDELESLPERELAKQELEELRLNTIEEETPEGKVIMSYNSDTESFWYYADSKSIPYSSLDAVARLYAVTYNCKNICVNYKEEWERGKERANKEKESDLKRREEEKDKPKPKSIFAKFKGYNKKQGADDEKKKYYIITEKANKFKYKGKISECIKKENANDNNPNANDNSIENSNSNANDNSTTLTANDNSTALTANDNSNANDNSMANANSKANDSNSVIEKKKIDYSTFKKIYIEKNN